MTQVVLQELKEGLLSIILNRPERRNATTLEMYELLRAAADRAANDREVRAVLLKGAGGYFCAGGDIGGMAERNKAPSSFEERKLLLRANTEISRRFYRMPKPVVAAVEGAAAGAGLAMALACDIRVVGETAKITTGFVKVGLSGDFGATYFMTKLVGGAKTRELFMLSPVLSGKEAHAAGIMTRVVPDAEVDHAAREIAMSLANGPPIALAYIKQNINQSEDYDFDACLEGELSNQTICMWTEDHKEAAKAFVEKRRPNFVGR